MNPADPFPDVHAALTPPHQFTVTVTRPCAPGERIKVGIEPLVPSAETFGEGFPGKDMICLEILHEILTAGALNCHESLNRLTDESLAKSDPQAALSTPVDDTRSERSLLMGVLNRAAFFADLSFLAKPWTLIAERQTSLRKAILAWVDSNT